MNLTHWTMICRLENIEEYAQAYFSTGHIHASNDLRRVVEVIFPFHVKGTPFRLCQMFHMSVPKHAYETCLTTHTPNTQMRPTCMLQYVFFFTP